MLSHPHFLHGDTSLIDAIDGIKPNETIHGNAMDIEPVSISIANNVFLHCKGHWFNVRSSIMSRFISPTRRKKSKIFACIYKPEVFCIHLIQYNKLLLC